VLYLDYKHVRSNKTLQTSDAVAVSRWGGFCTMGSQYYCC